MKRLIVRSATQSIILVLSIFVLTLAPSYVRAEDVQVCTQVTQYGGAVGVVCGVKHEPVETGLADTNPITLASIFFILAGASLYKYKKLAKQEIAI